MLNKIDEDDDKDDKKVFELEFWQIYSTFWSYKW